jgi:hypothetical protein
MRTTTDLGSMPEPLSATESTTSFLAVGVRSFTRGGVASSIHSLNEKRPATDRERVSKTTS